MLNEGATRAEGANAAGKVRRAARTYKGDRFYEQPGTGLEAPSVTSFLKVLPKPALEKWKREQAVRWVIENIDIFQRELERGKTVDNLVTMAMSAQHSTFDAAASGDVAHKIMEDSALGEEPHIPVGYGSVPEVWKDFVEEFGVEVFAVEPLIHNYTQGYSGSADLIAYGYWPRFNFEGGEFEATVTKGLAVIDYKTGKGLYGSTAYQNTAYAMGETYETPDGEELELPAVDLSFGFWLRPSGWALYPLAYNDDTKTVVRAARALYDRTQSDWKYRGKPANKRPIRSPGEAWPVVRQGE